MAALHNVAALWDRPQNTQKYPAALAYRRQVLNPYEVVSNSGQNQYRKKISCALVVSQLAGHWGLRILAIK